MFHRHTHVPTLVQAAGMLGVDVRTAVDGDGDDAGDALATEVGEIDVSCGHRV